MPRRRCRDDVDADGVCRICNTIDDNYETFECPECEFMSVKKAAFHDEPMRRMPSSLFDLPMRRLRRLLEQK